MRGFNFRNPYSVPTSYSWNEPVHFAIEPQVFYYLPAICLQGATVIVEPDAGDFADKPIGNDRRQASGYKRVFAFFAPSADKVTIFYCVKESRNIFGIIL